ncbi:hypothetical protein D3C72_2346230 [compost metagenome]
MAVARQPFGHLADLLALAVMFFAVGKRSQQAQSQSGAEVFSGHGVPKSVCRLERCRNGRFRQIEGAI